MKKILFTDLDGTLLDLKSHSFLQSISAIEQLKSQGMPIIFCSAKTRKEQEFYRESLRIKDPFIVENGSAIYIPKNYFSFSIDFNTYFTNDYEVIQLGEPVEGIRASIQKSREKMRLDFSLYNDLPVEDISMLRGLNVSSARRAMARDYSETILKGQTSNRFKKSLSGNGLKSIADSKFETVVSAQANKGRAVDILTSLYEKEFGKLTTYGVGDSIIDAEMLSNVDEPYLVQRNNGDWARLDNDRVRNIVGIGPLGWTRVANMITA